MEQNALFKKLDMAMPLMAAPMWGVSNASLTSAVARSGAFAFFAAGFYKDAEEMVRDFEQTVELNGGSRTRLGIGLVGFTGTSLLEPALKLKPSAVWLSFGDYEQAAAAVKAAGVPLIVQVQSAEEAVRAVAVGADAIVAQSSDSGGHGAGPSSTISFVPEVLDALDHAGAAVPVLAAGGICDGRQIAAALALGASGVVLGTRLAATRESALSDAKKLRYVLARSSDFVRTRLYDDLDTRPWPKGVDAGAVRNAFTAAHGYAAPATADGLAAAKSELAEGQKAEDMEVVPIWAGASVGVVSSIDPAGEVVEKVWSEAKVRLRGASDGLSSW